jgi:RNA polymerase sigma factor (sigma-70 family)
MAERQAGILLRHVRRVLAARETDTLADRDLLERFARDRDEAAFAALVRRHGPMVLHVCQRILHNRHDAEDAFQTAFLTLARTAASRTWQESVGTWLYLVASRQALRLKAATDRRARLQPHVPPAPPPDPLAAAGDRELCALLHEQLGGLPERYRAPLVLCGLEGRTRDEAARQLGWSLGTLRRRLEQGRELLRKRLERRGVGVPELAGALLLGPDRTLPLPAALLQETIAGAVAPVGPGSVTASLATGVQTLAASRRLLTAAWVLLAGLTAGGFLLIDAGGQAPPAAPAQAAAAPADQPAPPPNGTDRLGDPLPPGALARLGTTRLRTTRYHQFLPDGRRIVQSRTDGGLQISAIPSGKPLVRLGARDVPGSTDIIGSTIDCTPDGKLLAAVCWEGRCGIWDTATGRLVRWLESGAFYSIVRCAFSPNGKLLAVGGGPPDHSLRDHTVGVYEVASGRQLFTTPGTNAVFAPDGQTLVTWHGYGVEQEMTARRVAVPAGKVLSSFTYNDRISYGVPSDGIWFYEVLPDYDVRVWDVATGQMKDILHGPRGGPEHPVRLHHAPGRRELLAVGTQPARVWCWDLNTSKLLWEVPLAARAYHARLSRDGGTLVTGNTAGLVEVWDATTGKQRTSFRPGVIGHTTQVFISPDGKTVATASEGIFSSTAAFWDATTGKLLSDLPGHATAVTAAAFAPDGATVYTLSKDRTLRTWEAATGRELARAPAEPGSHLAVSPDGKTLFTARPGTGTVHVLNAQSGQRERQIAAFGKAVVGMALTADGRRLVVAGRDGKEEDDRVRVLDAATGARLREFGAEAGPIELLAIRADGEAVATTPGGRRVLVWDGAGKKALELVGRGARTAAGVPGEPAYAIGSVALSRDGRWLAYSDQEAGVVLVDVPAGREAGRVKPDAYYQNPSARSELRDVLAFAPDGKTVAWSGVESTADVFLIDVETRQVRRRLAGDSRPVQQLAFSPDGSRLLSAGPDGSALIWDLRGRP